MLKSALLMTAGIAIGFGANAVLAQSSVPYYLVAAINVKDQKAYEDSGVDKVRNAITGISGGKLIAGGYNKATVLDGTLDANRLLIFRFADKATLDKAWAEHIKPWQMSEHVRKLADFHTISVEGVEQK
jgi:uncharacterized protein (DUF1330 family)